MSRAEQCVGIGMGGAALGSVVWVAGNYHEKEARDLSSNSFFRQIFETDTQTEDRLADVDWYKLLSEGMQWTSVSIYFITTVLVIAQLTAKKR